MQRIPSWPGALCSNKGRIHSRRPTCHSHFSLATNRRTQCRRADPGSHAYQQELVGRARQARLADEREWHLLLHYQPNLLGGVASEEDDPGFFLSPQGKDDPQAELDATIVQLFSADPVGRSKQPAQCAFIARRAWLDQAYRLGRDFTPPSSDTELRRSTTSAPARP